MITEEQAREQLSCPACNEKKDIGPIVCWPCFKYRKHSLKESDKSFEVWLKGMKKIFKQEEKLAKEKGFACPLCGDFAPYKLKGEKHTWDCRICPFSAFEKY